MLLHDPQHRLAVLGVLAERTLDLGHPSGLGESAAGHDRGDGAGEAATFVRVVGETHRHQQGADVGVAQTQRPKRLGVLADGRSGVGGAGDQDLLARERHVDCALETLDVERALLALELHQVQGQQVARGVVEKHELRTRVGGIDPARVRDHIPILDRAVELKAGVTADPRGVGDLPPHVARFVGVDGAAADDRLRLPFLVVDHRAHEVIGDTHGVVGVLELDGVIGAARHVEADVVARVDQRPRLLLLLRLGVDEVHDIGVVGVEDDHLGRAPGGAA